jgi:hypothetical protein
VSFGGVILHTNPAALPRGADSGRLRDLRAKGRTSRSLPSTFIRDREARQHPTLNSSVLIRRYSVSRLLAAAMSATRRFAISAWSACVLLPSCSSLSSSERNAGNSRRAPPRRPLRDRETLRPVAARARPCCAVLCCRQKGRNSARDPESRSPGAVKPSGAVPNFLRPTAPTAGVQAGAVHRLR